MLRGRHEVSIKPDGYFPIPPATATAINLVCYVTVDRPRTVDFNSFETNGGPTGGSHTTGPQGPTGNTGPTGPQARPASPASARSKSAGAEPRPRRKKKATYKVRITNSGNAAATGVKLKVNGKGIRAGKSVGKIPGGKTKKVSVKVKPRKSGRIRASFRVTSETPAARQ